MPNRAKIMNSTMLICAGLLALACTAEARDSEVARAFRLSTPCPATGKAGPFCPGYVVDHKWPLCAGGPDTVDNMQYQTFAEAEVKDKLEHALCKCRSGH